MHKVIKVWNLHLHIKKHFLQWKKMTFKWLSMSCVPDSHATIATWYLWMMHWSWLHSLVAFSAFDETRQLSKAIGVVCKK